jgi:hypothetical protein
MFEHALNPTRGWPSPNPLQYVAKAASGVTVVPGMCCSLDSSGNLILGVKRHRMGLFAFQGTDSFDVNSTGNNYWQPINPRGYIMCLVAKGPFEFETTEFDTAQTYAYNDPVRAHTDGKLTNQSVTLASQTDSPQTSSTAVVGIVAAPKTTNIHGVSVLRIWPVWYPGRSDE